MGIVNGTGCETNWYAAPILMIRHQTFYKLFSNFMTTSVPNKIGKVKDTRVFRLIVKLLDKVGHAYHVGIAVEFAYTVIYYGAIDVIRAFPVMARKKQVSFLTLREIRKTFQECQYSGISVWVIHVPE